MIRPRTMIGWRFESETTKAPRICKVFSLIVLSLLISPVLAFRHTNLISPLNSQSIKNNIHGLFMLSEEFEIKRYPRILKVSKGTPTTNQSGFDLDKNKISLHNKMSVGDSSILYTKPITPTTIQRKLGGKSSRILSSSEARGTRALRDNKPIVIVRDRDRVPNDKISVNVSRQKNSGEALYKHSASFPESIINFADSIHCEELISHQEVVKLGTMTQKAFRIQNPYDSLSIPLNRELSDDEYCAAAGKINMKVIRQVMDDRFDLDKNKVSLHDEMIVGDSSIMYAQPTPTEMQRTLVEKSSRIRSLSNDRGPCTLTYKKPKVVARDRVPKDKTAINTSRPKLSVEAQYTHSVNSTDLIHQEELISHQEEVKVGTIPQVAVRIQNLYDSSSIGLNREPTDNEYCAAAGKINMEAIRQVIDNGFDLDKNKVPLHEKINVGDSSILYAQPTTPTEMQRAPVGKSSGILSSSKTSGPRALRGNKPKVKVRDRVPNDKTSINPSRQKISGETLYKHSASVPESMIDFTDFIHREERISHQEEVKLGSLTQEAIRIQNLYDSLSIRLNREPTDDEYCAAAGKINMEAIRQVMDDGLNAKNRLVTSNLRLVQSVVNTYIRNGLSARYNAGDLMQDGIVALIRAAEKFEPDRGWKFSTYAMYWVRASVKRSQISQSRTIAVPQRLYDNHKRLKRIEQELVIVTGTKPTEKELGEAAGMSELQVNRCMTAMKQRCYSLDQQISNYMKPMSISKTGDTLLDIVEGSGIARCNEDRYRDLLRDDLIESLHRHLSAQEFEIITTRFGLKEHPSQKKDAIGNTQLVPVAELSQIFGMKPDRIRRVIDNSLQHLKNVGLEEYLAFDHDFQ